jgi:hypothetical protein
MTIRDTTESLEQARRVLSRFPGPVTLYAGFRPWLLLAGGGLTAASIWIAAQDDLMGWLSVIFFGLATVVIAASMLPAANSLTLDDDGFEVKHLFVRTRIRWRDTGSFAADFVIHEYILLPRRWQQMVVMYNRAPMRKQRRFFNFGIFKYDGMLPNSYGLDAEDLASLMNAWRDRAIVSPLHTASTRA